MKIPFSDTQVQGTSRKLLNRSVIPEAFLFLAGLALFASGSGRMVYALGAAIVSFVLYTWLKDVIAFTRRMKGEARSEFQDLCHRLAIYSTKEDISGMCTVIYRMSELMETDFPTAHDFILGNLLQFIEIIGTDNANITCFLLSAEECRAVYRISSLDISELPMFLASGKSHIREAAAKRFKELQDG